MTCYSHSEVATDTPATLTRSLRLSQRGDAWITPLNLVQHLDHFRSFDRVESLTLSCFSCQIFDQTSLHGLFQSQIPSVRKLRLHYPTACPTSLLQFVSIFTNLQDTMVHAPHWITTHHQECNRTTFRTLRGELRLSELDEDSDPFFLLLASQTTLYEEVVLERCTFDGFHPLQLFLSNTGSSLRTLCIFVEDDRKFDPPIKVHICRDISLFRPKRNPEIVASELHSLGTSHHECRWTRGQIPADHLHALFDRFSQFPQIHP